MSIHLISVGNHFIVLFQIAFNEMPLLFARLKSLDNCFCLSGSYFTPDTYANEHSAQTARIAAGLCADLASEIFSGRAKNGFALV